MQTHAFLKNIDSIVTGEARDYFDDILWHHTVVTAKIFRALGSDEDDDILREDSRNSAAVAVKSLTICIMAFEYLASRYPEIAAKCKGLSAIAETIKKDVRARFTRGN
jgi:glycogen debranching enzyme